MLILQLEFCLEPIVQVVAVCATAFRDAIHMLAAGFHPDSGCLRVVFGSLQIQPPLVPCVPYLPPRLSLSFDVHSPFEIVLMACLLEPPFVRRFSSVVPQSENGTYLPHKLGISSKAGVNPPLKPFLLPSLAQSPRLSSSVDSRLLSSPSPRRRMRHHD
jgi:hypothetical protein